MKVGAERRGFAPRPATRRSQEPGLMPTSVSTAWLFWITLCFGCFLALFTPAMFRAEALREIDLNGLDLPALGLYCMTILSALVGIRWCVFLIMSYAAMSRNEAEPLPSRDEVLPFVSILVPAHCEAACIHDALSALVRLDYPNYEVIVVDDGSDDDTWRLALPFAGMHHSEFGTSQVQVFTKPNQGKWSAHNFALRHASADLILCIDADSRIESDALRHMVRRMRDPRVGAVSGQVRVRNRKALLNLFQAFEYVLANGGQRLAQGATGSVMIVPGPIGLFRRNILLEVQQENERLNGPEDRKLPGPFSSLTFAEDFQLSLTVLALGHRVEYEPWAIAHTKAPSTTAALISQRYRWNRGAVQVLLWYFKRRARGIRSPLKLNIWLWSAVLLDYLCFPLLFFVLLAGLLMFFLNGGSLSTVLAWTAAAWMLRMMAGTLYAIAHRDDVRLSVLAPLFDFYQGTLLNCAWVMSMFDQARGAAMRW